MRLWHRYRPGCCAEPEHKHPSEARVRKRRAYDAGRKGRSGPSGAAARYVVGVDGEGRDTPDGRHVYTYLCAADEDGEVVAEVENPDGLSFAECRTMLLEIPRRALCFGYMFSYDTTKIIEELTLLERYLLVRPELRSEGRGKRKWRRRVRGLDWFAGSLSVSASEVEHRAYSMSTAAGVKLPRRKHHGTKVWDCFRFFNCSFVEALERWDIGTKEERAAILVMKNQRGDFAHVDSERVKSYCRQECTLLAQLMRKVIDSHIEAGIPLRRFEGVGSTASVLLRKHKVADFREVKKKLPREVHQLAFHAYFGGRFEDSFKGFVRRPVYGRDIASAYPYAMTGLPCLACGRWRRTRKLGDVRRAAMALCRLVVAGADVRERRRIAWMPLPFRDRDGSICFPTGCEGWYHKSEALVALHNPLVRFHEAWVYETDCGHAPFAWVPGVYRQRCEWGKEGPGLCLKGGLNAGYGKLAQRLGDDPPYQSWLWAGAITAHCRAQVMWAIGAVRDPWHVLSVATDGIYSREDFEPLAPHDVGTDDLEKPLGSWERKVLPEGIAVVKPGLYYRLDVAELRDIRARGIGRREVFEHRERILDALERWDRKNFDFGVDIVSRRFYGAKHSIYAMSECARCMCRWKSTADCPDCGEAASYAVGIELDAKDGRPAYGRWAPRDIHIAFNPLPKREHVSPSGRMRVRDVGGRVSAPYIGDTSPEGSASRENREFLLFQPDWE